MLVAWTKGGCVAKQYWVNKQIFEGETTKFQKLEQWVCLVGFVFFLRWHQSPILQSGFISWRIIFFSVFPRWVIVRKKVRLIVRILVLGSLMDLLFMLQSCYSSVILYFCTLPPAKCRSKMFWEYTTSKKSYCLSVVSFFCDGKFTCWKELLVVLSLHLENFFCFCSLHWNFSIGMA